MPTAPPMSSCMNVQDVESSAAGTLRRSFMADAGIVDELVTQALPVEPVGARHLRTA